MYQFSDTVTTTHTETTSQVDELILNNKMLSSFIKGYRQLFVVGRGVVPQKVDYTEIPGRKGVWFNFAQDAPRAIEVHYLLTAETSAQLRERFALLNKMLRQTDNDGLLSVRFADDPQAEYRGVLDEVSDISEQQLSVTGMFSLFMPNPYAKLTPQTSTGSINLTYATQVLPLKIEVVPTATADTIEIINGTAKIVLKGSYQRGQVITVDYTTDDIEVRLGSRLILSELQTLSDLETFYLRNGDQVTARNATVRKVEWRDEKL